MRAALPLLALAGCDLVFQLDEDASGAGRCSTISMVGDDFTDEDELSEQWRTFGREFFGPPAFTLTGGRLQMTGVNEQGGGLLSPAYWDFRNGAMELDVDTTGLFTAGGTFAALDLVSTIEAPRQPADRITMLVLDGNLVARRYADGMERAVGSAPYDPIAHRRWRIAQSGTTTTWSVAPANGPYETFQQFENLPITHVNPQISMGCKQPACTVSFDNIGDGGGVRGDACQVASQRDDFAAEKLDFTKWRQVSDICAWEQVDGRMRVTYSPQATGSCRLETATVLDATAGSLAIEVADPGTVESVAFSAFAFDDHEIRLERVASTGMLQALDATTNQTIEAKPYDATEHRWWRFRGKPEGMVVEVSRDGRDWVFFAQTGNLGMLDRTRFHVTLRGGVNGIVELDHVNVTP